MTFSRGVTTVGWLLMLVCGVYFVFSSATDEELWCRKERPNLSFSECAKEFGY